MCSIDSRERSVLLVRDAVSVGNTAFPRCLHTTTMPRSRASQERSKKSTERSLPRPKQRKKTGRATPSLSTTSAAPSLVRQQDVFSVARDLNIGEPQNFVRVYCFKETKSEDISLVIGSVLQSRLGLGLASNRTYTQEFLLAESRNNDAQ